MTSAAYKIAEGISCRACGGTMASAHDNEFGLCGSCWTSVSVGIGAYYNGRRNRNHGKKITESDVTLWLAHKLEKDVLRFSKTGIAGRCEAISGWAYGSPGTQCANRATERRDGHIVCNRHKRATAPQYIGESADPYENFSKTILDLCERDRRFAEMICAVSASLRRAA